MCGEGDGSADTTVRIIHSASIGLAFTDCTICLTTGRSGSDENPPDDLSYPVTFSVPTGFTTQRAGRDFPLTRLAPALTADLINNQRSQAGE